MKISDIRESFSKGIVAITKTGVRILYTKNDCWITQCIQNMDTLLELSRKSSSVVFDCVRGFAIKISFLDDFVDKNTVLYQPIDTDECKGVDVSDVLNNDSEFFDFFINADLNNTEDFIGRINDFLEYYENNRELTEDDFRKYQKDWASFKRMITDFSNLIKCDYEEERLEWITVYFQSEKKTTISGEAKYLFTRAIEVSESIDIECNVDEAILNITFYI